MSDHKDQRPIRVAIVEDDRYTREGLAALITGTPGYSCVAAYRSVEEALSSKQGERPEVLLLDINLPGMPGSDGVKLLKEKHPAVEILMLTVYAEQDKVFESICNGACGYLLKKTPPARLLEAIAEARAGVRLSRRKSPAKWSHCFSRPVRPNRSTRRSLRTKSGC